MMFTTVEALQDWINDPSNAQHRHLSRIQDELHLCEAMKSEMHNHQITLEDIFETEVISETIRVIFIVYLATLNKRWPIDGDSVSVKGNINLLIEQLWGSRHEFYQEAKTLIESNQNGLDRNHPVSLISTIITASFYCDHDLEIQKEIKRTLEKASSLSLSKVTA